MMRSRILNDIISLPARSRIKGPSKLPARHGPLGIDAGDVVGFALGIEQPGDLVYITGTLCGSRVLQRLPVASPPKSSCFSPAPRIFPVRLHANTRLDRLTPARPRESPVSFIRAQIRRGTLLVPPTARQLPATTAWSFPISASSLPFRLSRSFHRPR